MSQTQEAERERACREHDLTNEILLAAKKLDPIITGQIERGHCVGGRECYGAAAGKRKTKLTDAVKIAKTVKFMLTKAVERFDA